MIFLIIFFFPIWDYLKAVATLVHVRSSKSNHKRPVNGSDQTVRKQPKNPHKNSSWKASGLCSAYLCLKEVLPPRGDGWRVHLGRIGL